MTPELRLHESGGHFTIRCDGWELASSRGRLSETELGRLACAPFADHPAPRVLIGGLGMGFSLRAALNTLPAQATVVVAELFAQVIEWNRSVLGHLAGFPLRDPRVQLVQADVREVIAQYGPYQAIVLDVDNGPRRPTVPENRNLYFHRGLVRIRQALAADGLLAVWSPDRDEPFARRLRRAGMSVRAHRSLASETTRRVHHVIYIARPKLVGSPKHEPGDMAPATDGSGSSPERTRLRLERRCGGRETRTPAERRCGSAPPRR